MKCSFIYSKPLTYAIALEKLGADVVHSYIGQEPSGRNFNELVLDYNSEYSFSGFELKRNVNFCLYICS